MGFEYPVARYRFEFDVETQLCLPEYAGSALRGAFGRALRQLACATRAKTCDGCILASACPYTSIFEPQKPQSSSLGIETPPVPYVIEPPVGGGRVVQPEESLSFHFILIGRAIDLLPISIMAWQRAFSHGVGKGDGRAALKGVFLDMPKIEMEVHRPGEKVAPHTAMFALPDSAQPVKLDLEFETPLRLQENGHALPPSRIAARPLLMALVRRACLLLEHHHSGSLHADFPALARAAEEMKWAADMEWRDWTRYSSRQGKTMQLGGCIGSVTLEGDLAPFYDFLRLGEFLHVGKETAFGLGKYRIL